MALAPIQTSMLEIGALRQELTPAMSRPDGGAEERLGGV